MADYKFKQQSGTNWKVNTSDKADAMEDTNEVRQILQDLGELLQHSKKDGSYPEDLTVGGYLSRLNGGNDADKPSSPAVRDIYISHDIKKIYFCLEAGVWTDIDGVIDFTPTHLEDQLFFGELVGDATNQNTTGVGVLYQKLGAELQFKGIYSTGNISVTNSTGTHTVNLDVISTGINHNDFGGLDSGNYQHLTQAEHDEITKWAGAVTLSTGGTINLVTFSTGGTINIPSGQEYQINGAEVKLDEWATPTTGTTLDSSTGRHGLLPRLGGGTSNYLRADGTWVTPPGAGDVYKSGAFTVGRLTEISTTGGVIKESPFTVTTGDVLDFGAHSAGFTEQAIAMTTGTVAINWNSGNKALYTRSTGTAGGAATFTFTAPVKSMNLMLIIVGTTGGCTGAVTLPTVYWGSATYPTFSTGASAIDGVALYYSTGLTKYLGIGSANFSTV